MVGFKQQMVSLNQNRASFMMFMGTKLKNFKNLSLGEQISYSSIGVGLILMIVSLVLFII